MGDARQVSQRRNPKEIPKKVPQYGAQSCTEGYIRMPGSS